MKLYSKQDKTAVEVEPSEVSAALNSGQFTFEKDQKVPINYKGQLMFTTPEYASKYRSRLSFVNERDVLESKAEERFGGVGGAAQAILYGGAKGLTLGALPALGAAVSPEFAEYSRDIELGRPGLTTAGELASLAVDPFALAGKVGQRAAAKAAAKGAEQLAAREAAQTALRANVSPELELGTAALFGPARQTPPGVAAQVAGEAAQVGRGAIGREVSPLALGRQAAAPTAEEAARLTAESEARQAAIRQGAIDRARAVATDEAGQVVEEASQRMRPLMGPTSPAEPGLRLGSPYQTPELAMRARQAEELTGRAEGFRQLEAAQMERVNDALQMRDLAAADAAAAEAARAGRIAGEVEAANTLPPTLRTAETRVAAENVSPRLGIPAAAEPNVSPMGLGMAETGVMPAGRGLALGEPIGGMAAAAPTTAAAAPSAVGPSVASLMAQGGVYGASEEARKQAAGESLGGMGDILTAGALGAAIPGALTLGGKVIGRGARSAVGTAREAGLLQKLASGAEALEKQHIMRAFDLSKDQITRLNNKFSAPALEKQGSDVFAKFIKGELDDVSKLKAASPDDAFLQSIPDGPALRFGQLTPDRKKAFADAVERFYGQQYDNIFTDAVKAAPVDNGIIQRIIDKVRATRVAGAPQEGLQSVNAELKALQQYLAEGNAHTVGSLKALQSRTGEAFRALQGESGKFTESQAAMYGGLKQAIYDAVEAIEPGAAARLAETDVAYEMSKILSEGANRVLSKATTTSPIGRDLLSQFALGFAAVGHPLAATKFFLGAVGLRHLYNTRGEGIIADLTGKLSTSLRKNPTLAAAETADTIINSKRPMLLGMSATKFLDTKPEDYSGLSKAIRELEATRDRAKTQLADATMGMDPQEQQKAVEYFDNQLNALASKMPKGIPTGKALSEQEKSYAIFARSILDPHGYGVQAILNGGPGSMQAAEAIQALGPQGQEFLQKLGDDLQARISESQALRGDDVMLQTLRNVKSVTRKSLSVGGGGGARLRALHPGSTEKFAKGAASAFQNAAKAFGGTTAPKF